MSEYVIPFEKLRNTDVAIVGGKNASLGEMISQLDAKGVRVPTGFATTSTAFNDFLKHSELETKINESNNAINVSGLSGMYWVNIVCEGKKITKLLAIKLEYKAK